MSNFLSTLFRKNIFTSQESPTFADFKNIIPKKNHVISNNTIIKVMHGYKKQSG